MDEGFMAEVIGDALNQPEAGWQATGLDIGEVHFTAETGDKYVLVVTKVDEFP